MTETLLIVLAYAGAFLYVGIRRPMYALMLTFAVAPFQTDLSGDLPVRFSLAEVNLVLSALVYFRTHLLRGRKITLGPLATPILFYIAVCCVSSISEWRPTTTISLVQTALHLIVVVIIFSSLGESIADFGFCFHGLLAAGTLLAASALIAGSNSVFGLNKNGIGGSLSCCVLVALELWLSAAEGRRRRLLLLVIAILSCALVNTLSRGAWLGTLAGMILLFCLKAQFKVMLKTLAVLAPLVAGAWAMLPPESQEFAVGFEVQRENIGARLQSIEIAREWFEREPLLGMGVGLRKEFDATNLVMTTLAETGVLGLIGFMAIHGVFFWMLWTTSRRTGGQGMAASAVGIGGALILSKLTHGMVDHYWSRGSLMLAWAGAGMVTRVYLQTRHVPAATGGPLPPTRRWRPPAPTRAVPLSRPTRAARGPVPLGAWGIRRWNEER